ncbi:MAG: tyrosine-type recombinase/integrase [Acidobacteria bacterium]|nr:tyrosine-type recombinase/integrase [Acidobacteriota bacterium]
MGKLKTKMEEEMALRGLRPRSQKSYLYAVRKFVEHYGRSPRTLGQREVRAYLIYLLKDRQLSDSTVNQALHALKFFYRHVLERGEVVEDLVVKRQRRRKLPVILTREEVERILSATEGLLYQTLFMTLYATGLRLGEGRRLRVEDIDREAMRICVRDGKGGQDRAVMLSPRLLYHLETYWWRCRPRPWLFARPGADQPIATRSAQRAFQRSVAAAGIEKKVSAHSLRHAFATHLLEQGTSLLYIQQLLGHRNLTSTMIYTRLTETQTSGVRSPFDTLIGEAPERFW